MFGIFPPLGSEIDIKGTATTLLVAFEPSPFRQSNFFVLDEYLGYRQPTVEFLICSQLSIKLVRLGTESHAYKWTLYANIRLFNETHIFSSVSPTDILPTFSRNSSSRMEVTCNSGAANMH